MRDRGNVTVGILELLGITASSCERRPSEGTEGRQDEPDSSVGDRLCTCGRSIAVDDAAFCEALGIYPVEASASRCVYPTRLGKQRSRKRG